MKHLVFVVNPRSGTDRVKAIAALVAQKLDARQYTYEICLTTHAGHGTELAREAAGRGAFAVVAVGGDGSVRDVAKGLYQTRTALAIIPKGSGNGFARSLGIPLDLPGALGRINDGHIKSVDVGFANEQLFLSNAGVAFDAEVSEVFAASNKRGFQTYTRIILKRLFTYKARQWRLCIDGKETEEDAFMVVVANGSQFGYNFKIAADASCTDGLFNLVVVRRFPAWASAGIGLASLRGRLHRNRFVKTWKAAHIEVAHPELRLLQTDGDAHLCAGKVVFRMAPRALPVLC